MTTIATDGRSMAGDGQQTHSNDVITGLGIAKVRRLPDGSIIGICGDVVDALSYIKWLECGGTKPKFTRPFEALLLSPKEGLTYRYTPSLEPVPCEAPAAIGHGMQYALAAMDCGKSPAEAVEIAARRDPYTGGKITTLRIDDDAPPTA